MGNTRREQAMKVLREVWTWNKAFLIPNKGQETRIYKHTNGQLKRKRTWE
jgi:hypothetical protein